MRSAEIDDVLRVLVAQADPDARACVREVFEDAGMVVCAEAATDEEALEAVHRERPDVSVVDAAMAADAIALAARIKEALPHAKVVLLNTVADENSVMEAARAGAEGYLPEVDLARLPDVIRAVVAGEAAYPRGLLTPVLAGLGTPKNAG
jgi:DNA-binding NarL/FixJ family response regulator